MPNLTPSEQARLDELDAVIEANKLHIAPLKKERNRILARSRWREWHKRESGEWYDG